MNNMPFKIVYVAVALPEHDLSATKIAASEIAELSDSEKLSGFVFAENLIDKNQADYESPAHEETVGNMMTLIRKMDELWLVSSAGMPHLADFDANFRLELRVAQHDGIKTRRFVQYPDGTLSELNT